MESSAPISLNLSLAYNPTLTGSISGRADRASVCDWSGRV